jgi:tetrathionate reductase subunit C
VLLLLFYAWLIYRPGLALQASHGHGMLARLSKRLALGGAGSPALLTVVGYLTLVSALLVALYTGTEMAVVKARPLWHGPMMPLLLLITGISGAAGFSLLLNRLLADNDAHARQQLGRVLGQGLSLGLLLTLFWFLAGASGASASGQALQRLAMEYNPLSFTLVWLLLCSLLPLVLLGLHSTRYYWLAGSLGLLGAWMFRWSMFMDGQRIPKTGAGFYDYTIPLGHEGWLGMLGTLGLCVALLVILTSLLPWQAQAPEASTKQPPIRHTDLQEKHS